MINLKEQKLAIMIMVFGFIIQMFLACPVSAAFNSQAIVISSNLLEGYSASSISSFYYNISSLPSDSSVRIQFSQNNSSWYSASGVLNEWDDLTIIGGNSLSLSSLDWSGSSFYYKIELNASSDLSQTPVIDDVHLSFIETGDENDVFVFDDSGNVGIGTSNPSQLLNIVKSGTGVTSQILVQAGDAGAVTTNKAELVLAMRAWDGTTHSSTFSQKVISSAAYGLSIDTDRITNPIILQSTGGNVGIGTTTPEAKLDVDGLIKMRETTITQDEDVINKGYLDAALDTAAYEIATSSIWQGSLEGDVYNANTGNIGIGITAPEAKLDILGALRATSAQITLLTGSTQSFVMADAEGNLFATSSAVAASALPRSVYVGATASTYNGNNNDNPGYDYAHALCETEYPGSHVCTSEDMLSTVKWGSLFPSSNVWVFSGPPGYTASANDCNGRNGISSSGTDYGAYWEGLGTTFPKGRGLLINCNQSLKIACCK